ncbi:hypothetical protein JYK14_10970 [Siccirubricoccus sp. KC 17139]|uniref:Uncharacterized protein n=1 Tax=Siccirubricoccus soli TaxID=2899147 RepID=A0ABT1D419_9PROT|nr:hypothetical protein [Siccirubricoccus soli]MCO6416678.1 hypothetical protein [Siccirubricoccus soli]MCP2682813.1 hypothetical protein [Siccirubricoccus soli]
MDIPPAFVAAAKPHRFASGPALLGFFQALLGQDFTAWFEAKLARQEEWQARDIPAGAAAGFAAAWTAVLAQRPCSLMEVLAFTAIMINETGGSFQPLTEKMGRQGHPGLAYLFDAIPGVKRAYNQAPNLTAGQLFRDAAFNAAHGGKALGTRLAGSQDPAWDGIVYPQASIPTQPDPAVTGYVMEADFCKFRGRGLIQTTWRSGYRPLVGFVQAYAGPQKLVAEYRNRWAGLAPEAVLTASSTADWDRLFQQSDLVIPCAALLAHARAGGYLPLAGEATVLNGTGPGSVFNMGKRISGGDGYATLFKARLARLAMALPKLPPA